MVKRIPLILAVLLAVLAFVAACGDQDGDEQAQAEGEGAVRAMVDAWNGKDPDALLGAFTDNGLQEVFNLEADGAEGSVRELIGFTELTIGGFSNTDVSGQTGTTEVPLLFGRVGAPQRLSLVKERDVWKIEGREFVTGDVGDAKAIDLDARDFAFEFNGAKIEDGNIAFNVTNTGEQDHEILLATIPPDADVEQLLMSEEEEPEGVEEVGFLGILEPGVATTLLFTEPLDPARYLMVCFIPDENDPEGTPHALKGQWAEFTIE